ncbi:MAG TPA: zinc ribbon domain-containing protein [Longimicrobiales bacterium]|nr:zinc ribbon domain-containing protein [Longimicrobiales bacterium]
MEMFVIALVAIAAFAAVLLPLFRRRPGYGDDTEFENIPPASSESNDSPSGGVSVSPGDASGDSAQSGPRQDPPTDDAIEAEVMRYREAVRSGTVCRRCGQANPPGSAYCYECGARLPLADAMEFE